MKKKRGRAKGSTASMSEGTPKQEAAVDSQGEETSPGKEVVSRSGRKIKPKRFADFSSSEEAETGDKNGMSALYGARAISIVNIFTQLQPRFIACC